MMKHSIAAQKKMSQQLNELDSSQLPNYQGQNGQQSLPGEANQSMSLPFKPEVTTKWYSHCDIMYLAHAKELKQRISDKEASQCWEKVYQILKDLEGDIRKRELFENEDNQSEMHKIQPQILLQLKELEQVNENNQKMSLEIQEMMKICREKEEESERLNTFVKENITWYNKELKMLLQAENIDKYLQNQGQGEQIKILEENNLNLEGVIKNVKQNQKLFQQMSNRSSLNQTTQSIVKHISQLQKSIQTLSKPFDEVNSLYLQITNKIASISKTSEQQHTLSQKNIKLEKQIEENIKHSLELTALLKAKHTTFQQLTQSESQEEPQPEGVQPSDAQKSDPDCQRVHKKLFFQKETPNPYVNIVLGGWSFILLIIIWL